MTIYVDELREYWSHYRGRWCHMMTDGELTELHDFANRLGLLREWFQDHVTHPHYDLVASKRRRAIELGAVETDTATMLRACAPIFCEGKMNEKQTKESFERERQLVVLLQRILERDLGPRDYEKFTGMWGHIIRAVEEAQGEFTRQQVEDMLREKDAHHR